MTNPAQAMRMLVTYAICIPLAIFMGFTMTEIGNNPDYSNLFVVAVVVAFLASPIVIRWHYPIMVFGLGCPMMCFFIKGKPPLWEVVVLLSLGIAIVERAINSERRFISVPVITWPLIYTAAMVLFTAEMTGGIGLHALGGDTGGGQKYLALLIGICIYFALTSRKIPAGKRNLYVMLVFLSGLPVIFGDLFPYLAGPFKYINLLFPPSGSVMTDEGVTGTTRLGAFGATAGVVANFMLARYGLRGIFSALHPFRFMVFCCLVALTLLGGFRLTAISYMETIFLLFFMEGLHRTRMVLVFAMGGILIAALLVPFADKLPYSFQRALSFLPIHVEAGAKMDADGSRAWREKMWSDVWPKVPQYLLLGKGYALHAEDFALMGGGAFEGLGANLDASEQGLAISGDYHSGPLSTLMPFGIWGAISYVWVALATLFALYRNYRYSDADIKTVNTYFLAIGICQIFGFFFLFGSYAYDIGNLAKLAGWSIAFNWGIKKVPAPGPAVNTAMRRLPSHVGKPRPLTA
ncbi:MAG TPA: O-antigen ligase family protein [Verrucomicrobiae bacterium]|nr:O-antigen ligase family protein [Verrucomicrobiae bacterium]